MFLQIAGLTLWRAGNAKALSSLRMDPGAQGAYACGSSGAVPGLPSGTRGAGAAEIQQNVIDGIPTAVGVGGEGGAVVCGEA
jgi:hypothetical protein